MQPTSCEIMEAVEKIENSAEFETKPRMRQFLRYVVTEAIEGRASRIKTYSISVEVFGRSEPDDVLVRTTAGRLRHSLNLYYNASGIRDKVGIEIPKGSYVPSFEYRSESSANASVSENNEILEEGSALADKRTSVFQYRRGLLACLVLAFFSVAAASTVFFFAGDRRPATSERTILIVSGVETGAEDGQQQNPAKFENDLVGGLLRGANTTVFEASSPEEVREIAERIYQRYVNPLVLQLSYGLVRGSQSVVVHWRLKDPLSNIIYWADSMSIKDPTLISLKNMAERIAFDINGSHGAISRLAETLSQRIDNNVRCQSRAGRIPLLATEMEQKDLIDCLTAYTADNPTKSDAWAALSIALSYFAETHPSNGHNEEKWSDRAKTAALKANESAGGSYLAKKTEAFSLFYARQYDKFKVAARKLLETNPNDPNLKIQLGSRLVRAGDYKEGRELLLSGMRDNPLEAPINYASVALSYIGDRDYAAALEATRNILPANTYIDAALQTVSYAGLGDMVSARAAWKKVLALKPNYDDHIVKDLRARGLSEELVASIMDTLTMAQLGSEK